MTKKELLAWGEQWHYPQLVLEPGRALSHGKESYEQAKQADRVLATFRIDRWNELAPTAIDPMNYRTLRLLEKQKQQVASPVPEEVTG